MPLLPRKYLVSSMLRRIGLRSRRLQDDMSVPRMSAYTSLNGTESGSESILGVGTGGLKARGRVLSLPACDNYPERRPGVDKIQLLGKWLSRYVS